MKQCINKSYRAALITSENPELREVDLKREVAATSRKDKIISESKQYIDKSYRTSLVTSTTQSLDFFVRKSSYINDHESISRSVPVKKSRIAPYTLTVGNGPDIKTATVDNRSTYAAADVNKTNIVLSIFNS